MRTRKGTKLGILNASALPAEIHRFLNQALELMRATALPSVRHDDHLLSLLVPRTELVLTDSWMPLASVGYTEDSHYRISIDAGLVFAVTDAVMLSLQASAIVPELPIEERQRALSLRDTVEAVFLDYSFVPRLPSGAAMRDVVCTVVESEQRLRLAYHLIDFALAWISLHERAHILQGHFDLFVEDEVGVLAECECGRERTGTKRGDSVLRQALELQADAIATVELCERNTQPSIWNSYSSELLETHEGVYRFTAYAVGIVMQVLRKLELSYGCGGNHPPTDVRFLNAASMVPDTPAALRGLFESSTVGAQNPRVLPPFPMITDGKSLSEVGGRELDDLRVVLRTHQSDLNQAVERVHCRLELSDTKAGKEGDVASNVS